MENNPRIEIARQQYSGTEGTLTQARSNYLPHLTAGADYGRKLVDYSPPAVREDNVGQVMIAASQLLYDFGRTIGLVDTAGFQRKASGDNLKQVYHDTAIQLKRSLPEMPDSMDVLLDDVYKNRPSLIQFDYLFQAADTAITQARGDYWPSIDVAGAYNEYETDIPAFLDKWHVGVFLTWEIFSDFETGGKVAEANAKLREVKAALRELNLAVKQDATEGYLRAVQNR